MKTNFKFKNQLIAFAYLLLAVVFLVSCTDGEIAKRKQLKEVFAFSNIEVIVIDSCEYIYVPNGNGSWGAHKGNCKFCLARSVK